MLFRGKRKRSSVAPGEVNWRITGWEVGADGAGGGAGDQAGCWYRGCC